MSQSCLTDYISIDNLQIILDETSQQDGIALRIWSPKCASKQGTGWITPEWSNACHFHTLIRSYPSGHQYCYQYFEKVAHNIFSHKKSDWKNITCPTSLYIFGWPILGNNGQILAILFGGLIRGSQGIHSSEMWSEIKQHLSKDHAVIKELENEFLHAPQFTKKERNILFEKWKLFCALLSQLLTGNQFSQSTDSFWIDRLTSFHSCSSIALSLTKIKSISSSPLKLSIIDNACCSSHKSYYQLVISNKVLLGKFENCIDLLPKIFVHQIPINKQGSIMLAFDTNNIKTYTNHIFWEISSNIISAILMHKNSKDLSHRKILLERQSQIFEKTCKKSITSLAEMIEELFGQLRDTGVINIDYASFSEVIYPPDEQNIIKPCFKARVVYPKEKWSENQRHIIEKMDLYAENLISQGSTVCAFQKSRTVLDRDTNKSPTYIPAQPDVQSSLVMPINYGPLVLGVISFDSIHINYFNDERKLQLENLTQLISPIVYHNSFQEVLDSLNTSIKKLAQPLTKESREGIRKHILIALSRLIQAEAASFWDKGEKENTLYRGVSIGKINGFNQEIDMTKSAIGELSKQEPPYILISDLSSDNNKSRLQNIHVLIGQGVSSYLAFPVNIGDKEVIISFYRFKRSGIINRKFSSVELNITQRLGKILSFYETLNDIFDTQRKELETQLESRKELVVTLAHNIKSPLSSTFARLDDVKRKLKGSLGEHFFSDHYSSLFGAINGNFHAIKRTTDLVLNRVLLEESYDMGFFTVRAFHLHYDILTKQIARVRRGLKIHGKLEKRVISVSGHKQFPLLYGDKTAIDDMISNILENAVKYSSSSSKIFIETQFDYIAREIQILIKNEGNIPILKTEKERIFEYAYRSEIARNKDPNSTGVGLYYSRLIAEQHGAQLTIEQLCNPVVFKLTIPIKPLGSVKIAEKTLQKKSGKLNE